jgi:molybdopterin molybdotransferase
LDEALALTLAHIGPLPAERIDLAEALDRAAAEDLRARVDSPSVDASLKDGYAVRSLEVATATAHHPVRMTLAGCAVAGGGPAPEVTPGITVRVLTGARIPKGADAVVAEEFATLDGAAVTFANFAEAGRNVMARGSDVAAGEIVVRAGERLTPGRAGLLAAAGHRRVAVARRPTVAIVATGDEVVAPGQPLPDGKLYASNMVMLGAWCRRLGMPVRAEIAPDDGETIFRRVQALLPTVDALITSGGAWSGDRDLVAGVLERLGWRRIFHRIRMGPGKAVGFGLLAGKPVFILPGGPPSNLIGFLQIALPGLLRLAGDASPGLPTTTVRLTRDLTGRHNDWTQFVFGTLDNDPVQPGFVPLQGGSRLRAMAAATAVVAIPEGQARLTAGASIRAQLLS